MQNTQRAAVPALPRESKSELPEQPVVVDSKENGERPQAGPAEQLGGLGVHAAHEMVAALAPPWNHLDWSYKPGADRKSSEPDEGDARAFEATFENLPRGALDILQQQAIRQGSARGVTELTLRTGQPALAFSNLRELSHLEKITLHWPHPSDLDLTSLAECRCADLHEVHLILPEKVKPGLVIDAPNGMDLCEAGPHGQQHLPAGTPPRAMVQFWVNGDDGRKVKEGAPFPLVRLADLRERRHFQAVPPVWPVQAGDPALVDAAADQQYKSAESGPAFEAGRHAPRFAAQGARRDLEGDDPSEPGGHSKRARLAADSPVAPVADDRATAYSRFNTIPAKIREAIADMAIEDYGDAAVRLTLLDFVSGRRSLDEVDAFKRDFADIPALDGILEDRSEYEAMVRGCADSRDLLELIETSIPRQLLDEEMWLLMVNAKNLPLDLVGLRPFGLIGDTCGRTPRVCAAAFRKQGAAAFTAFPGGNGLGASYLDDPGFMRGLIREHPNIVVSLPLNLSLARRAIRFEADLVGAVEGGVRLSELNAELCTERVCVRALQKLLENSDHAEFIRELERVPEPVRGAVGLAIAADLVRAIRTGLSLTDIPRWILSTDSCEAELENSTHLSSWGNLRAFRPLSSTTYWQEPGGFSTPWLRRSGANHSPMFRKTRGRWGYARWRWA